VRSTARHSEADQESGGRAAVRDFRDYVPTELLNVSFPGAVRGYDRGAVDAYVKRVNRVIAEVKVSASPRAAVRHALRQTEQEVSGLLERARETADQVTTSALREAETEADGIKAKAADLLVNANAEAEATKAEAEKLWLTQRLRRTRCSRKQGQKPKTSSFVRASRQRTPSRVRKVRPTSGFSSYRSSSPLCGSHGDANAGVPGRYQRGLAAASSAARGDARHGKQAR
jgi:DivIVA domain-containing protein